MNSFDNLYEKKSVPRFSIDVNAAPSRLSLRRASTAKKEEEEELPFWKLAERELKSSLPFELGERK